MAIVGAHCSHCERTVETTSGEVTLWVESTTFDLSYRFECPDCHSLVMRDCNDHIFDLLFNVGAPMTFWTSHPPLAWDDALDLHNVLDAMPTAEVDR